MFISMFRSFKDYWQRVKQIDDNPFWVMNKSRLARASRLNSLVNQYGAYIALIMLPLFITVYYQCQYTDFFSKPNELSQSLTTILVAFGVLQLFYLALKAAITTAPSVVNARQQGTLLALALTRINSADFADGVALSETRCLLREFLVWTPVLALLTLCSQQNLYSLLMLIVISGITILYFAYQGIYISATSETTQEAGRKASQYTLMAMVGLLLLLPFGGMLLGPVTLLHPVCGYLCTIYGLGGSCSSLTISADNNLALLLWCGLPVLMLPFQLWFTLRARQQAIKALERIHLG